MALGEDEGFEWRIACSTSGSFHRRWAYEGKRYTAATDQETQGLLDVPAIAMRNKR